ncbi:MAG: right-handed parallel beta-helix repeat-containing protein [Bacteriovoracia bacterium]
MERKDFLKTLLFASFSLPALANEKKGPPLPGRFKASGDGKTDDSSAFKEYLNHHDVLDLEAGKVYKIGNIILKGKTIRGPGKIKIKTGSSAAFILEGNNNKIADVEFVSEGTGQRPESEIFLGKELEFATIRGCTFSGKVFTAIGSDMNSTKDAPYSKKPWRSKLIITDCFFKGEYAHHLYFHRLKEVIIQGNFFENSKLDSIRLRQWVEQVNINNNQFKNIGTSSSTDSKDAIDCFWSGLALNIQGNQMENISTHGLDIKGHSPDFNYGTSKVIISGNQIRNAGFSGILISSGARTDKGWKAIKNITVSGNHIEGCGNKTTNPNDAAIFMRHNQEMILIDGNQIYQNKHKGIMLGNFEKDAPVSKNILIKGNLITGNGSYGIHISGGENVLVNANILDKNEKGLVAEKYRTFPLTNFKASENIEK